MTAAADSSEEPQRVSDTSPTSAPGHEQTPTATTESNDDASGEPDLAAAAAELVEEPTRESESGNLPTVEDAEPGVSPDESPDGGQAVDEGDIERPGNGGNPRTPDDEGDDSAPAEDGGEAAVNSNDPSAALADLEGPQGDPEERRLDQLAPADTSALDAADAAIDEAKAAVGAVRRSHGEDPDADEEPDDPNPPGAVTEADRTG